MNACQHWRDALRAWEIPPYILAQAPESPWFVPDSVLRGAAGGPTVSHRRALEALPDSGTVLDIGAGTGAMSRPLRSRAGHITVVDTVAERLAACDADARVLGRWPDVAQHVEPADVVVCGHVLYNVADVAPFVDALSVATRRRAVIELTAKHPRAVEEERALWRLFWGIDRPRGPTWQDAAAALRECGVEPVAEQWQTLRRGAFDSLDDLVAATRRRLCLASDRDEELRAALDGLARRHEGGWVLGDPEGRLVTLWWDAPQP